MALLTCRYSSDVLGLSTTATVILPQATSTQIGMPGVREREALPVLYLLHGLSDDDSIWLRRTSVERYASELGIAVVMPAAHRSFYTDQADGYPYFTHIAEELPEVMRSFFPLSDRREDTFVAGLSMGGYGALKLALRHPERFAAAASLSGALDVAASPAQDGPFLEAEWRRTFGDAERARAQGDDLMELARTADPAAIPPLWAWCGTEDRLIEHNLEFRVLCASRGIRLDYSEGPGDHSWEHWDRLLPEVLAWLPLR
jgi:S-formylglutathione hydrolase FrmB